MGASVVVVFPVIATVSLVGRVAVFVHAGVDHPDACYGWGARSNA